MGVNFILSCGKRKFPTTIPEPVIRAGKGKKEKEMREIYKHNLVNFLKGNLLEEKKLGNWTYEADSFIGPETNLLNWATKAELENLLKALQTIGDGDTGISSLSAAIFLSIGRKPIEADKNLSAQAHFIWAWREFFGVFPAFFNPLEAVENGEIKISFSGKEILIKAKRERVGRLIGKGGSNINIINNFFFQLIGKKVVIKEISEPSFFGKWCREVRKFEGWQFYYKERKEIKNLRNVFLINCPIVVGAEAKWSRFPICKLDIRLYDEYQYSKSLRELHIPEGFEKYWIKTRKQDIVFGYNRDQKLFILPDIEGQKGTIYNPLIEVLERVVKEKIID